MLCSPALKETQTAHLVLQEKQASNAIDVSSRAAVFRFHRLGFFVGVWGRSVSTESKPRRVGVK